MTQTNPVLSVIIPHLNEPNNLNRCLRSLDAQTSTIPVEIIVVDNGSVELPRILEPITMKVRIEREPVPGPGPARNRGVTVARAELLAFIDADCVADRNWMSSIVTFFEEHPNVDFVGGDIRLQLADPGCMSTIEAYESLYSYRNQTYVERHGFSATGNMAVRSKVFQSVGPFGGISTMEDTEWGKRATAQGHPIAYLGDAIVSTPSCQTFGELARRWDRHVAHEFHNLQPGGIGLLGWFAKSAAVASSPVGEIFKIAGSDRLRGGKQRILAFLCMTRVRFYRASQMIRVARRGNAATLVDSWNRENP